MATALSPVSPILESLDLLPAEKHAAVELAHVGDLRHGIGVRCRAAMAKNVRARPPNSRIRHAAVAARSKVWMRPAMMAFSSLMLSDKAFRRPMTSMISPGRPAASPLSASPEDSGVRCRHACEAW